MFSIVFIFLVFFVSIVVPFNSQICSRQENFFDGRSFALHPFAAFRSKLCKVLDKLVRQPLTAVRSASVPRAPAAKAEIAVDSRILLHTPHRPEAVRKIDIRIRWKSMITGFIFDIFWFSPVFGWFDPRLCSAINWHAFAGCKHSSDSSGCGGCGVCSDCSGMMWVHKARRSKEATPQFRNSIATKLSDNCSMLLGFFSSWGEQLGELHEECRRRHH